MSEVASSEGFGSTHFQALVSAALQDLGFESLPNGPPGSPSKFRATVHTLQGLRQDREFQVNSQGKIVGFDS